MTPSPSVDTKNELAFELPPSPALTPTLADALLAVIKNSGTKDEPSAGAVAGSCHPSVIAS